MPADPRPSAYRSDAARDEALGLYAKALSRFSVPVESRRLETTLVLLGRDDPIYDAQEAADRVRRLAPHVAVDIVPDAGHVLTFEQPGVVDAALVRHFASGTAP